MFAPLTTATNLFWAPTSLLSEIYRLRPASANAPAGSVIDLVSEMTGGHKLGFPLDNPPTFKNVFYCGADFIVVDSDYPI